jgi:hypothetical protein
MVLWKEKLLQARSPFMHYPDVAEFLSGPHEWSVLFALRAILQACPFLSFHMGPSRAWSSGNVYNHPLEEAWKKLYFILFLIPGFDILLEPWNPCSGTAV